ncbi:MAG: glutathione S-transferase family protein [Pseudomonadota bacterium]
MIKVISFKICPFVQRVTALLEAKRIPYEIEYISLADKPKWFTDIAPNGQVPVLITETGVPLFESDAIIEYIDEITEQLEAGLSPELRAVSRAWSQQATKNYLVQCSAMRSGDEQALSEYAEKLGSVFAKVENALGDGPFFNGGSIGNVDVAWLTILHRADIINRHTCYDFLAGYPKIKAWQSALMASGLAEKSVAEDFEEAFTNFYLSDETYLGNGHYCDSKVDQKSGSGACC